MSLQLRSARSVAVPARVDLTAWTVDEWGMNDDGALCGAGRPGILLPEAVCSIAGFCTVGRAVGAQLHLSSREHSLAVLTSPGHNGVSCWTSCTRVDSRVSHLQIATESSGRQETPLMPGSPSSAPAAALPSFFFANDADNRMTDEDYLPSWSRASATSPHPAAVDAEGSGQAAAGPSSSSRSAGAKANGPGATQKDVGMGQSPVLNPTHLVGLDLDMAESSEALSRAIFGGNSASSFASSFTKFQDRSPDLAETRKSPRSRRKTLSNDSSAPLSFANVASLSVTSPAGSPSVSRAGSSIVGTQLSTDRPRTASSKQHASGPADYAGALPDGLHKRSTNASGATELDELRIQVRDGRQPVLASIPDERLPIGFCQARVPVLRHLHSKAERHYWPSTRHATSFDLCRSRSLRPSLPRRGPKGRHLA